MTELLELGQEFLLDRKRIGRKEPVLFCEEAFLWEGSADGDEACRLEPALESNVQRPTLERSTSNAQ